MWSVSSPRTPSVVARPFSHAIKEEGTHTEPGHGSTPESDTSKIDQPARKNVPSNEATPQ